MADFKRGYINVMLVYSQDRDILLRGMTDRYSWIEGLEPRKDKARRCPCPYDAAFKPKPMYTAIAAALAAAPRLTPAKKEAPRLQRGAQVGEQWKTGRGLPNRTAPFALI